MVWLRVRARVDLRERKLEHMERIRIWHRRMGKYRAWCVQMELHSEAQKLLHPANPHPADPHPAAPHHAPPHHAASCSTAPSAGCAQEHGEANAAREQAAAARDELPTIGTDALRRRPPGRPVFTLFGPRGHFNTLQQRLVERVEREKRKQLLRARSKSRKAGMGEQEVSATDSGSPPTLPMEAAPEWGETR